jgi:hypothetical protein
VHPKSKNREIVSVNKPVYKYRWFKKIKIRDEFYIKNNYRNFDCLDIPENKQKIDSSFLKKENSYIDENDNVIYFLPYLLVKFDKDNYQIKYFENIDELNEFLDEIKKQLPKLIILNQ